MMLAQPPIPATSAFSMPIAGTCLVKHSLDFRVEVNTLEHEPAQELALNEIGRVRLRTGTALMADPYARNRTTGSFILIDESSNDTVAAGMILGAVA